MEVRISFADGDQAAGLESLGEWLHGEPELAGRVSVAGTKPRAGELGALADALVEHRTLDGARIDETISRTVVARQLAQERERGRIWQDVVASASRFDAAHRA